MPTYLLRKVWTPLALFGVRLYLEMYTRRLYIRVGDQPLRRVYPKKHSQDGDA